MQGPCLPCLPEEDKGWHISDVFNLQLHDLLPGPRLNITHVRRPPGILLPRRVDQHLGKRTSKCKICTSILHIHIATSVSRIPRPWRKSSGTLA